MAIKLLLDGVEIEMNKFVQKFFTNVIEGAISSLSGTKPDWKHLELIIEKD